MVTISWKKLTLLSLLLLCTIVVSGQSHALIQVDARVDRGRIALGQTVMFTITVQNAAIDEYKLPDLIDFKVVGGPFREENATITAGQSMVATQIKYELEPLKTGVILIGPVNLNLEGRIYRTNSRRIEVLPAGTEVEGLAPDNFLRLEVDREQAYVGQQLIVNLRLYTTVNRQGLNPVSVPDFDGFIRKARNKFDSRTKTVTENGKTYLGHTVESYALYPVRTGRLTIAPYEYSMSVREYRISGSGFREPYTDFIELQSDSLSIEVKDLPLPAPTDFSGGIGNFRLTTTANRDTMTTDDALTLRMVISGEGDIFRVRDLQVADTEDWDIYPPDIEVEDMMDSPTGYFGRKILEYKIVPRRAGKFELTPSVMIFDPDSSAYVLLAPETFELAVSAGDGQPTYDTSATTIAAEMILAPSIAEPRLILPDRGFRNRPMYWFLLTTPLLLFGGLLGKQYWKQREERIDPAERAQSRAARAAYQKLRTAKKAMQGGDTAKAYALVEEALLDYPKQKWQQSLLKLSKDRIKLGFIERGLDTAASQAYVDMLRECEGIRYAGLGTNSDDVSIYDKAKRQIEAIEQLDRQKKPVTD